MIELIADEVKLVSTNRRLAPGKGGRWFTTKDYKQCKTDLTTIFKDQYIFVNEIEKEEIKESEDLIMKIDLVTYKDIDNPIKLIIDIINDIGIIKDDKYITKLILTKKPIKRGYPESLKIQIDAL